jgi:predicted nuclease with RNAse H fold
MGISCFFTNKGSIIRNLIYRGIALSRRLRELGFDVIETYPHATKVILFGDRVPPKNSAASLAFMKERLLPLIGGLGPHLKGLDRNGCDAVLNAYTGLLHSRCATDVLGTPEEGTLVLPKLAG